MFIYIGNWVVDREGDYCKVTRIDDNNLYYPRAVVWGHWSDNPKYELNTDLSNIVGKYRTRKEAKMIADIIKQREEN